MALNDAEDFLGLFAGQFGIAAQQARGAIECDFKTGGGVGQTGLCKTGERVTGTARGGGNPAIYALRLRNVQPDGPVAPRSQEGSGAIA